MPLIALLHILAVDAVFLRWIKKSLAIKFTRRVTLVISSGSGWLPSSSG